MKLSVIQLLIHKEIIFDDQKLKELEDNDQIIFKYTSKEGLINNSFNPNGSKNNIAGIVNKKKCTRSNASS